MMTNRDFDAIADILFRFRGVPNHIALVEAFAAMLYRQNHNFNMRLFEQACGLPPRHSAADSATKAP